MSWSSSTSSGKGSTFPNFTLAVLLHERRNRALGNKRDRSQKDENWTEVGAKDVTLPTVLKTLPWAMSQSDWS